MGGINISSLWPLLLPLIILIGPAHALPNDHFIEYFSGYAGLFEGFAKNNCTEILDQYRNQFRPECANSTGFTQCISGPAVECLYEGLSETQKNNLGAAAILLGLLPTILAMGGSTAIDSGFLSMRRPLLALLLTVGAPVMAPVRMTNLAIMATETKGKAIGYGDEVFNIKKFGGTKKRRQRLGVGISTLQYLVVIGASVHTLYTSIELGVKGACSFSTNSTFLPLVWAVAGIPVHIGGAVAMRLRYKSEQSQKNEDHEPWWKQEWTPCILREDELRLQPRRKTVSILFVILSWAIMITTIIHVLFGTLVFSSTMFVNTADALWLALRYLASTILCRAVMAFEVDGLAGKLDIAESSKGIYDPVSGQPEVESGATHAEGHDSTKA